jgi:hypothetical protein
MSTSKNLRGFLPARMRGSGANSTGFDEIKIASNHAQNIFTGDLVEVSAGSLWAVSAGATSVGDASPAIGVFMGCHYVENGEPKWNKYWPTGTSATDAKGFVDTNPWSTYYIQADATLSAGDINSQNFGITVGSGSTVTGQSGFGIKAASRSNLILDVRPINVLDEPGNDITVAAQNAFPVVEVRLIHHVDLLTATTTVTT